MLESRKSKTYNENKVVSIIGQGTTIKGDISSQGTIRIEGTVSGNIQSGDTIVVQESGKLKADLVAGQIIISGEVHGNVVAHGRLEICAGGKVVGDIMAPRVSIAEGVLFEGKCTMKAPGDPQTPQKQQAQQQPAKAKES